MVRSVHIARPRLQIQSDLGLSRESMRYMHALHKPGELLQFSRAVVPNNRHQNQRAAVVHHLLPILHHVSQGITGRKWETGTEVRWSVGGWLGRSESRRTGSLCDGSFQPIAAKIVQQMSRKSAQLVDRGVRKVSERVIMSISKSGAQAQARIALLTVCEGEGCCGALDTSSAVQSQAIRSVRTVPGEITLCWVSFGGGGVTNDLSQRGVMEITIEWKLLLKLAIFQYKTVLKMRPFQ